MRNLLNLPHLNIIINQPNAISIEWLNSQFDRTRSQYSHWGGFLRLLSQLNGQLWEDREGGRSHAPTVNCQTILDLGFGIWDGRLKIEDRQLLSVLNINCQRSTLPSSFFLLPSSFFLLSSFFFLLSSFFLSTPLNI